MADSDEDFFALGTPFEQLEDDAPRKKPVPIHDQVVTDSSGRRRFHGAFTGGFSAGYFNTVDTKEGWTPKAFVSSRSQKSTEARAQKPEDFMDEEDLGEFGIAPKRVVTTEKFLSRDEKEKPRKRNVDDARQESALAEVLRDHIVPVKMSLGVKLLTQMGWKEGQGVGPRVRRVAKKTYGCAARPNNEEEEDDIYAAGLLFAPKDVKSIEFTSKDNVHGIGYSGINPKTALLNQRDWLGFDSTTKAIGIKGQGFGVGALEEEDDDIYKQDNLSNYDVDLNQSTSKRRNNLHGWTGPPQTSQQGGLLSVFAKASKPPPARKLYPPPIVPRDFNSVHKTQSNSELQQQSTVTQPNSTNSQKSVKLSAKERGEALGEVPLPTPKKSVFDYIAKEDKTRLKESREKVKTPKQQNRWSDNKPRSDIHSVPLMGGGSFKPFADHPERQARYELYLSGKSTDIQPSKTDSKMTEWERECETEGFARAAMLYRPLSQTMAARFTTAKDSDNSNSNEKESKSGQKDPKSGPSVTLFGALTRQRCEWHPDRVLCKRFNIPDPYPGAGTTGVPTSQKKTTSMDRTDRQLKSIEYKPMSEPDDETESEDKPKTSALMTGFQAMMSRAPVVAQESQQPSTSNEVSSQKGENETDAVKLASMDLFKAVFAESSSELSDSENSSSDEEEKSVENTKDEIPVNEETQTVEVKEDEKLKSNNDLTPKVSSSREQVSSELRSIESSSEVFGPALPSSSLGHRQSTSRDTRLHEKNDALKLKPHKKKKKQKSKKSKKTDSHIDSDGDYERRRKNKKKIDKKETLSESSDTEDDHEIRLKGRTKARPKEADSDSSDIGTDSRRHEKHRKKKEKARPKEADSDSSDSETDSRRREKHRMKKEKKSKEGKRPKNKRKDKSGKHLSHSDFNLDDYVERTAENVQMSSTNERKKDYNEKQSGSMVASELSRDKHPKEDDATSGDTQTMNKDILSKLKNIQLLKERKRMRAADFM